MPYICGQEDHEDLTGKVAAKVADAGTMVALGNATEAQEWRVVVHCSKQHANVFAGRGQPGNPDVEVMGQTPNDLDDLLVKAAAHLSPVESLSRLDNAAKFFIGLVSTIGMLGTALGLLAVPASAPVWLVTIPAICAAVSIALALGAVTPRSARVSITNVTALQAHLDQLILRRSRWVRLSGVFLAIALLSLPVVRALAEPARPVTRITFTARASDQARAMSVIATIVGVTPAEVVDVEVRGFTDVKDAWEQGDVIAASSGQADEKGSFEVTFDAQRPATEPYTILRARAVTSQGSQEVKVLASKSPLSAN